MQEHNIDICTVQETRHRKPEKNNKYNVTQEIATKKNSDKHLHSGLITLMGKEFIVKKNESYSNEYVNTTDIDPNIKVINMYA